MEEFAVQPKQERRTQTSMPLKIRCLRHTPTRREYILVGRKIPVRPDTSAIEKDGIEANFVDGKLIVTVASAGQWLRINQSIANAVAVAADGTKARPV